MSQAVKRGFAAVNTAFSHTCKGKGKGKGKGKFHPRTGHESPQRE
jgi:hypothetical protein